MTTLRVAILTHSTNPRGGVVHALELGGALAQLGHEAVVHAPDAAGSGFFRSTGCTTVSVPAQALPRAQTADVADTYTLVETRVADYLRHFADPRHRRFDVFHAQDGISGNALATMKARGWIDGFVRTVHHIDSFVDERLVALQRRSIASADAWVAVSPLWADHLRDGFGVTAAVVGNGVDLDRFSHRPDPQDIIVRKRLGLLSGPVFLAVGGIEARKNTLRILQAFADVLPLRPDAQLVIAGGASLLDHHGYQAGFAAAVRDLGVPDHALRIIGTVPDAEMPALYRNADALVFPSLKEGFGLVVLEAMACGVPVIASSIAPFTDYLAENDAVWCTPEHTGSIADAMMLALLPSLREALVGRGRAVAARHGWDATARAHLPAYERVRALHYA